MTIQSTASAGAATATLARPAVAAEGLVKTYPRGVQALKGVSFSVSPGALDRLLASDGGQP